jgi:hypothetical protein
MTFIEGFDGGATGNDCFEPRYSTTTRDIYVQD